VRSLSDNPEYLQRRLQQLLELRRTAPTAEVLEALAECTFRLAIAPETEPAKAIELLSQASRWDRGNPKYGYHIARLLLAHGDVDRGGEQLQAVQRLYRTSHRIWAHLALVQRELDLRYSSDKRFERKALAERSAKLLDLIRDGADTVPDELLSLTPVPTHHVGSRAVRTPEPTKNDEPKERVQPRVNEAGKCRWTGVYDLKAEQLLEAQPSADTRDQLTDILRDLIGLEPKRYAAFTAFAITAIQWLLCGYPPGPIRRLLAKWPSESIPSVSGALLSEICELTETPEADLPQRLAQRIGAGALPAPLAALIHERRLLYVGSNLADYWGSYRAARRFLDQYRPADEKETAERQKEEAIRLQQELKTAADHLEDQPRTVPDVLENKSLEQTPAETRMLAIESRAAARQVSSDELFNFLKNLESRTRSLAPVEWAQAQADHASAIGLVNEIESRAKGDLEELNGIRRAVQQGAPVENFSKRAEQCSASLSALLNRGRFDKKLMAIARAATSAGVAGNPSQASSTALVAIRDALVQQSATPTAPGHSQLDRIHELANAAQAALAAASQKFVSLKALPAGKRLDSVQYAQLVKISEFVASMERDSKQALEELSNIRTASSIAAEAIPDLDAANNANLMLANEPSRFKRRIALLDSSPPDPTPRDAAAAGTVSLASKQVCPVAHPVDSLRAAIAMLDRRVDAIFAAARQSFDVYGSFEIQPAAIADLRRRTISRQAATLYSFGRHQAARKLWLALSRENRLDPDPLHNIALCHTIEGDSARALIAWQACAEAEYFRAIVEGTPKSGAQTRAVLHGELSAALGFASLRSEGHPLKAQTDAAETAAFLSSTARVRAFVDHQILSFWNARLDVTSPPLFLGVGRAASEGHRQQALEQMKRWAVAVWKLLPPRIADGYARLCWNAIQDAAANCGSARRLTRQADREYDRDEKYHEEWLGRVIELKVRLSSALLHNESVLYRMESLNALAELVRLDEIPIDCNPQWRDAVGRSYVAQRELEGLQNRMKTVCERLIANAIVLATSPCDAGKLGAGRASLYERIAHGWFVHPLFGSSRALFDDPSRFEGFYSDTVTQAFGEGASPDVTQRAQKELEQLIEMFPYSSGPVRHLALILIKTAEHDRAAEVLSSRLNGIVCVEGAKEMKHIMAKAKVHAALASAEMDPTSAFEALLESVSRREIEQEDLPKQFVNVALQMAMTTGKWAEYERLRNALRSWNSRKSAVEEDASAKETTPPNSTLEELPWMRSATKKPLRRRRHREMAQVETVAAEPLRAYVLRPMAVSTGYQISNDPQIHFDPEVDPQVVKYLLAATGVIGKNPNPDWFATRAAMGHYLARYQCPEAVYWHMLAAWNLATISAGTDREKYLQDAESDAAKVIAECQESQVENARKILENIKTFRFR